MYGGSMYGSGMYGGGGGMYGPGPMGGPWDPNDPNAPPQPPSAWQAMLHAISGAGRGAGLHREDPDGVACRSWAAAGGGGHQPASLLIMCTPGLHGSPILQAWCTSLAACRS